MKHSSLYLLIPLMFLIACVSAEQTAEQTEQKSPDVYVFDEVKKVDEVKPEVAKVEEQKPEVKVDSTVVKPPVIEQPVMVQKFTVQLGAFTTKERAETFVKDNQAKTSLQLLINYNEKTKLFAIQIPSYKTKEEADLIRDNLRKFPVFGDSFTITTDK
jgi:cell division protein FtsN